MAKKLRQMIGLFFKSLVTKWLEDFFILIGVSFVVATTYMEFGVTVGNYLLGFLFLLFGFLIAKK